MFKVNKYQTRLNLKKINIQNKIDRLTKKAARLKTTNPAKYEKIMNRIRKKKSKFLKHTKKIETKIEAAKEKLKKVSKKYEAETIKLQNLMDKKMYKSQKRLTSGLSTACANLGPGKHVGCSEAIGICRSRGVNVKGYLKCMHQKGFNIQENDLYKHMESSAKSHFIRRFKRARQLREIKRLKTQGAELQKIKGETIERVKDSKKMIDNKTSAQGIIKKYTNEVNTHVNNSIKTLDRLDDSNKPLRLNHLSLNQILSAKSAARTGKEINSAANKVDLATKNAVLQKELKVTPNTKPAAKTKTPPKSVSMEVLAAEEAERLATAKGPTVKGPPKQPDNIYLVVGPSGPQKKNKGIKPENNTYITVIDHDEKFDTPPIPPSNNPWNDKNYDPKSLGMVLS
jgi:hypothetical protein